MTYNTALTGAWRYERKKTQADTTEEERKRGGARTMDNGVITNTYFGSKYQVHKSQVSRDIHVGRK